jgi:hypothetical protein
MLPAGDQLGAKYGETVKIIWAIGLLAAGQSSVRLNSLMLHDLCPY